MPSLRKFTKPFLACFLLLLSIMPVFFQRFPSSAQTLQRIGVITATQHYLYVIPDQSINVYDMDNNFSLVKSFSFSWLQGVRGVVADPASAMLYISYNGDGGAHGNGSLLKYNLLTDTVVWTKNYNFGIDSMAITPDGKTIYMPDGVASYDGTWHILNASDGSVTGSIFVGTGVAAHNTIVSLNGSHVYLGGINYDYLVEADTSTNKIIQKIGPLQDGVRPFTINGTETLAFTTATCCLGFQVSSITTGQVLYTVLINGFTAPPGSNPSHGISLSPDEKEVYVMDSVNSYVHVFDVSGLPNNPPKQVADIALRSMTGDESPCLYDCTREGWVLHSGDGRYVFVGDSGDVIDTTTRASILNLQTLYNTRKYLEIDWANGVPVFTTSRYGLGYVTGTGPTPTPSPSPSVTVTPSPSPSPSVTVTPSPTPASTLAQDTFQRANQTYWGTASDGHTWGGDANKLTVFSISSNTGQVSNGSNTYNAVLGPVATNAEVLFTGSMSTFKNTNLGALLRWTNGNNWYEAYIDGSKLIVQKRVKGTITIIGSTPFTATGGTSYILRFRMVGTTLYVRAWQTGTTEPTNWMVTVTDTALSSGYCGLRLRLPTGAIASYTSFLATSA
jgi:DNA-binding beta-propeller fold protein YncE